MMIEVIPTEAMQYKRNSVIGVLRYVDSNVLWAEIVKLRQTLRNLTYAVLPDYLAQAVVLLLTTPLAAEGLPADEPLPQVGQLYVLLGNPDDARDAVLPAHVGQNAEDEFDAVRADAGVFAPPVPQVAQVKESVRPVYPTLEKVCAAPARVPPLQPGQNAVDDRAADAPIDNADIVVSSLFLSEVLCYRQYRKTERRTIRKNASFPFIPVFWVVGCVQRLESCRHYTSPFKAFAGKFYTRFRHCALLHSGFC